MPKLLTTYEIAHTSTPSTPGAGYSKMYFKSDGSLYKLNSSGQESLVDTQSSGNITYSLPAAETIVAGEALKVGDYTTGGGTALPSNTKLYAELNGNSTDTSGTGNTGIDNAISYVSSGRGDGRLVAQFNGVNSYINKTSAIGVGRAAGETLSISSRIKVDGGVGTFRDIVGLRGAGGTNWIFTINLIGQIEVYGVGQHTFTYTPALSTWITVGLTVSSTGILKLYINGVLNQTLTGFSFGSPYTDTLSIGSAFGVGSFFNGGISDVLISQDELTAAKMLEIHNTVSYSTSYNISQLTTGAFPIAEALGANSFSFVGQSITTIAAGSLTTAKFYLCNDNPSLYTGNIVGQIRSSDGTTIISTSNETVAGTSIAYSNSTYTEYTFTFPTNSLSASTSYLVGLEGSLINQGSQFVRVRTNVNSYPNGALVTYAPYNSLGLYDLVFDFTISTGAPAVTVDGVLKASASNTDGFIGIAKTGGSAGTTIDIDIRGINTNQIGLIRNATYYLSNTPGAISTTPGTNSIVVGKALSATKIII